VKLIFAGMQLSRFKLLLILLITPLTIMAQLPVRTTEQLTEDKTGFDLVKEWADKSKNRVEFLPVDRKNGDSALYHLQVTTRSPMGAIIYFTGGILVDNGWIRILGSGSEKLTRNIVSWNKGKFVSTTGKPTGLLLVADDVIGGMFAINAGALGTDIGNIYYFAPESLKWQALRINYSDFLTFCFNGNLSEFYKGLRWNDWQKDIKNINGDQAYCFFPFLWTKEGKDLNKTSKRPVPTEEIFSLMFDNE
jgi:hypothetical protein